jgi:hypothetical protein
MTWLWSTPLLALARDPAPLQQAAAPLSWPPPPSSACAPSIFPQAAAWSSRDVRRAAGLDHRVPVDARLGRGRGHASPRCSSRLAGYSPAAAYSADVEVSPVVLLRRAGPRIASGALRSRAGSCAPRCCCWLWSSRPCGLLAREAGPHARGTTLADAMRRAPDSVPLALGKEPVILACVPDLLPPMPDDATLQAITAWAGWAWRLRRSYGRLVALRPRHDREASAGWLPEAEFPTAKSRRQVELEIAQGVRPGTDIGACAGRAVGLGCRGGRKASMAGSSLRWRPSR